MPIGQYWRSAIVVFDDGLENALAFGLKDALATVYVWP